MRINRVFLVLLIISLISGCKTKKIVSDVGSVIPIDEVELVQRVEKNYEGIDNIYFQKSLVQFESDKVSQSFRSNIYLDIDKTIRISVLAPMGIEVARVSLEPGIVTIIDRMSRNVIYTDYDEVLRKFGVEIDFYSFQNILLNRAFSLFDKKGVRLYDYHLGIENQQYKLSSVKERSNPLFSTRKSKIIHKLWIQPGYFYLNRTSFSEKEKNLIFEVRYEEFEEEKKDFYFPQKLKASGSNGLQQLSLIISHNNIEINGDKDISFQIPEKYDKIYR
jgi:hypothetical protein